MPYSPHTVTPTLFAYGEISLLNPWCFLSSSTSISLWWPPIPYHLYLECHGLSNSIPYIHAVYHFRWGGHNHVTRIMALAVSTWPVAVYQWLLLLKSQMFIMNGSIPPLTYNVDVVALQLFLERCFNAAPSHFNTDRICAIQIHLPDARSLSIIGMYSHALCRPTTTDLLTVIGSCW